MRKFVLLFAAVVALAPFTARAQNDDHDMAGRQHRLELKKQEIDLDRRWSDLQFHKEMQKIEIEKARAQIRPGQHQPMGFQRHHPPCMFFMMGVCAIVHILLGIWVFQDIRRRSSGSGIWIIVVLLTGFFGAIVYALVRLGDIRAGGSAA